MNDQDGFKTKVIVTIDIHFILSIIKLLKRIDDSWCTTALLYQFSIVVKNKKQEKIASLIKLELI